MGSSRGFCPSLPNHKKLQLGIKIGVKTWAD